MAGTYRGKYVPTNKHKYKGNADKITYRSSWELAVMKWCDFSPMVKRWNSEEIVVPYLSKLDHRMHRYFMDFYIELENGLIYLWEVKPYEETQVPKTPKRNTPATKARYLEACFTHQKNRDKWLAADKYAKERGWIFKVMTENALTKYGILNGRN